MSARCNSSRRAAALTLSVPGTILPARAARPSSLNTRSGVAPSLVIGVDPLPEREPQDLRGDLSCLSQLFLGRTLHDFLFDCALFDSQLIDDSDDLVGLFTPYPREDRKSTRLNSSHVAISYAVF